jgi:hypothetical protein
MKFQAALVGGLFRSAAGATIKDALLDLADKLAVAFGGALRTAIGRCKEMGLGFRSGDQVPKRHLDRTAGTRHFGSVIKQPSEVGLQAHVGRLVLPLRPSRR